MVVSDNKKMSKLEATIIGLFVGIACPFLGFVAFWWTAALLHLQGFPVPEGVIKAAALTGLGLGCLLDVLFLRRWVGKFYMAKSMADRHGLSRSLRRRGRFFHGSPGRFFLARCCRRRLHRSSRASPPSRRCVGRDDFPQGCNFCGIGYDVGRLANRNSCPAKRTGNSHMAGKHLRLKPKQPPRWRGIHSDRVSLRSPLRDAVLEHSNGGTPGIQNRNGPAPSPKRAMNVSPGQIQSRCCWAVVVLYAIAMAWVESAVVFYLRYDD